jgi:2'-5' RNA ligase
MAARRIFIAIDLSDAARAACVRHIDKLRKLFPNVRVGWERPEKLHITLRFLGDTDEAEVKRLDAAIAEVAANFRPFVLHLSGPGVFPSRNRPRILWIGTADTSNAVIPLRARLENVCRELGFPHEERQFAPHVTIGRIRQPSTLRPLVDAHVAARVEPVEFDVTAVAICESELRPTGSVYSKLSSIPLKAS